MSGPKSSLTNLNQFYNMPRTYASHRADHSLIKEVLLHIDMRNVNYRYLYHQSV